MMIVRMCCKKFIRYVVSALFFCAAFSSWAGMTTQQSSSSWGNFGHKVHNVKVSVYRHLAHYFDSHSGSYYGYGDAVADSITAAGAYGVTSVPDYGYTVSVPAFDQTTKVTSFNPGSVNASIHSHDSKYPFIIQSYPNFKTVLRQYLTQRINNWGGNVIHVGHTIKVVLPSAQLFRGQTWYLLRHNMKILNYVAGLISTYNTMNVGIKAYYGYYLTKDRHRYFKKLTTKQAQRVERYLWSRCNGSRLMYARGYGIRYPVASDMRDNGRYYNSRVEIIFHYYYDRVL